jgi:chromosomal replication initiation ATPase DnaA
VSIKANRFAAVSLGEVLQVLSRHAIKYKQEYGKIPVLIIDNANRLAQKQQELLDLFQDYAKDAADKGRVTVVFMLSEGHVPRSMMGKSIMFIVLF